MDFSPQREQELLEINMPKIYRAVDNFTARCSSQVVCVPYEDFVQEVSIAFLEYIRRCKTEKQLDVFPWFSAMDAMRRLVLQSQPMSCPKSSVKFSEIIHNMPVTMSLEVLNASTGLDIDGMSKHWVDDKETQIDFDVFMAEQPENVRRVASMRVYGMTLKQIGDQCGVSKVAIYKKLNELNELYKNYMEGCIDD